MGAQWAGELGHRAPLSVSHSEPPPPTSGSTGLGASLSAGWVPVSEVSSARCVSGQTYHGMSVPRRHTVPWRRLGWAAPDHKETDVTDGSQVPVHRLGPPSGPQPPPQGPLARTAGGGGVSPGRVSSILSGHTWGAFTRLSQQETLRGSEVVPSPSIFSGTTMKSCICIFF